MTLPSCWPVLNIGMFSQYITQIKAAGKAESQEIIQELVDQIYQQINTMEGAITSQLAVLNPILDLLTAPIDPAAAVTWIETFITSFLTPYVLPIEKYTAQLADIAIEVVAIADAISEIESLRPEISITIPAFPNITCSV